MKPQRVFEKAISVTSRRTIAISDRRRCLKMQGIGNCHYPFPQSESAKIDFFNTLSEVTDSLLERVRDHGAVVPSLWFLEITNVLLQAERRNRITASDVTTRLELLRLLPISIEHSTPVEAFNSIITLARIEGLTSYDAAYLELAIRQGLPLATLDKRLAQAAKNSDIEVLP